MKNGILIYSAIALMTSGCSSESMKDISSGLSTISSGLSAANSTLSGKPSAQKSAQPKQSVVLITQTQINKISDSLDQKTQDKNINQAILEATPVIGKFLEINSCIAGYNGSTLNQFAAPGKSYPEFNYTGSLVPRMRYHDKSSCVTILRTQGWKMPAKNALQFETTYVSDNSGESFKHYYEVVKQPSGEWLFTR